jgi:hypothetical protein
MGGEIWDRDTRRSRRRANGDEVRARRSGPDNKETRRIVEHAVVPPHRLDAAHGMFKAVSDEPKTASLQLARATGGKESPSPVDPDSNSGSSGAGDQIGIAIAIDIRDHDFDDQIPRLQPVPAPDCRKSDGEFGRSGARLDAIVKAIAVDIRARTLRLRDIWNQQRRDAAQGSDQQSVDGDDRSVDDAVASQGSCDLNPAAIMQNPDSF